VAAAVEVDEGLEGDLLLDVLFLLCFGHLLAEVVEGGYVGVVVVFVVELHDFAGDGGFEGAVVVCEGGSISSILTIFLPFVFFLILK